MQEQKAVIIQILLIVLDLGLLNVLVVLVLEVGMQLMQEQAM